MNIKPLVIPWRWEQIDNYHQRVKVPGGWLVKSSAEVCHDMTAHGRGIESGWDWREAMAFVPDANHEWKPEVPA